MSMEQIRRGKKSKRQTEIWETGAASCQFKNSGLSFPEMWSFGKV